MRDVIIIGAGVIGCSIARELAKRELDVLVLERKDDVATGGCTKANTAIVHAGYDAKPGTKKAYYNVRGNPMFDQLAADLEFPFIRNTSLVVAFEGDDIQGLFDLFTRGVKNGVPDMQVIDETTLRKLEPNIGVKARAALRVGTGGIVCPYEMTIALAENAMANGVEFRLLAPVESIRPEDGHWVVKLESGEEIATKTVVNAAGMYSDHFNNMVSSHKFEILPRRGEYYMVDKTFRDTFNATIFQLPTDKGKGILVSRTVDGTVLLGPTANDIDGKEDTRTTAEGLSEVLEHAAMTWNNIPSRNFIGTFAGIRPRPSNGDFWVGEPDDAPNFFNAAGIESPGLTSAPAIAEDIALWISERLNAKMKENFNPKRHEIPKFRELSNEERAELIAKDPAYGRIVCRCETVTEGEIREAIRRGARNLDAVKRRTRAGMGRCQAGFCTPRVVAILCDELGLDPTDITKFGGDSKLLTGRIGIRKED
jgi:glycerol-3-phosphate dehydrogenase